MARGTRRTRHLVAVTALAVAVAGCAVDSDGVLRPNGAEVGAPTDGPVTVDEGVCADLLDTVQTSALAVVGPNGLPSDSLVNQFNGRGLLIVDQGFGFEPNLEEASTLPDDTHDAVVLDDHVVVSRDGWLHVLDGEAGEVVNTTWLGSVAVGRDPLLLAEGDGLLIVHETSTRVGDQVDRGVRIARVAISDTGEAEVLDSIEVLGSLAGLDIGDTTLRLAVRRGAPDLDLVQATTAGAEDAALEVNRAAIAATVIDDWVPLLRHEPPGAEPTESLIGDCDVVMPPGSETALGTTALLQLELGASLGTVEGSLVMGDSAALYDDDHVWLMSSRNTVVGFGGDGSGGGTGVDRVVTVRLGLTDEGYVSEAAGIVAGRLLSPAGVAMADDSLLVLTSADQWGQQLTLTSVGGTTELLQRDSETLELEWWGLLDSTVIDDVLTLNRQGGSATVDLSDPGDLDIETRVQRWDRGVRVGADQVFPMGDGRYVASSGGQIVNEWGSVEIFFQQILANEFGGVPRLEDWFGAPGQVRLRLQDGSDEDAGTLAEWEGEAFGLWVVAADADTDSLVIGVAGLRDPDDPPILGGELFTGAVVFERDGDTLVERSRTRFVAEPPDDVGATDCERAQVDQFLLDVAGLWNSQLFTCGPDIGAGVVGYACWGVEFGDIDPEILQWQWGIDDTSAFDADLEALRAVVDEGGSVIACRAKQRIEADAPLSLLETGGDTLWVRTTAGIAKLEPDQEEISVLALEPPYGA